MFPQEFERIGEQAWTNGRHTISITKSGRGLRIEREAYHRSESGDLVYLGSTSIYDGDLPPQGLAAVLRDLT